MGEAIGVDVPGLHGTGRTISHRSGGAGAAANGLKTGLDGARMGHHAVHSALASFVTDHVLDHANKLPTQIDGGGVNVSNVASTARDSDNSGGSALQSSVTSTQQSFDFINKRV